MMTDLELGQGEGGEGGEVFDSKLDQGEVVDLKIQGEVVDSKLDQGEVVDSKLDQGEVVDSKLDQGEVVDSITLLKVPYMAALKGDWDTWKSFFTKENHQLLFDSMTINLDTALHIAAYSGKKKLLQHLVDLLPDNKVHKALSQKNDHGNNTFHEVATTNKVEAAKLLVEKLVKVNGKEQLQKLLDVGNDLGETPVYRAAAHGHTKMAKFLVENVAKERLETLHFQRDDRVSILHIAVIGQYFDTALWLLKKDLKKDGTLATREATIREGESGQTCLQLLAKMPTAFRSTSRMGTMKRFLYVCLPGYVEDVDDEAQAPSSQMEDSASGQNIQSKNHSSRAISRKYGALWKDMYHAMWKVIAKECPAISQLWWMKVKHASALELTKILVKKDTTWIQLHNSKIENRTIDIGRPGLDNRTDTITIEKKTDKVNQTSYSPLLIATSKGIVEIVDNMIEANPQGIEHTSSDAQNILHVAISHRKKEIFQRMKEMETIVTCRLASRIDNDGYTILHHAADTKNYDGGHQPGPAFKLQEELKWFKRVQNITPSHYVMHRDSTNQMTAEELFKERHSKLLENAQKWIKETSQSCSAVAVLIATVVFAAAYTVPGGNDNTGHPVFLHSPFFLFFTIMDVLSLASSLTSVVMFLSILSSPFEYENFRISLPRKLTLGFTLLFFSVTTTMLSFAATILLIIHFKKTSWTTTVIYTAAFLPVSVFALMQFPLYKAFSSTLRALTKKILKTVLPQKFIPRYLLRTITIKRKSNKLTSRKWA